MACVDRVPIERSFANLDTAIESTKIATSSDFALGIFASNSVRWPKSSTQASRQSIQGLAKVLAYLPSSMRATAENVSPKVGSAEANLLAKSNTRVYNSSILSRFLFVSTSSAVSIASTLDSDPRKRKSISLDKKNV